MHMHGPSEHRIEGQQYDLEIHIVHELVGGPENYQDYKETLAVVGIMFKVAEKSHPFIEKLRPMDFGRIDQISFNELFDSLNATDAAMPADNAVRFYHYKGSLTNPPCADVVNWILHKEVLPITEEHLEAFKSIWMKNLGHGNYRDCQPLCGRKIVRNFEHLDDHVHDENCMHSNVNRSHQVHSI
jgi:carbonic anhydrase